VWLTLAELAVTAIVKVLGGVPCGWGGGTTPAPPPQDVQTKATSRATASSQIEVAAPYEPGTPAIFVPAQIRHVEKLPDGTRFRYGVAYLRPTAT